MIKKNLFLVVITVITLACSSDNSNNIKSYDVQQLRSDIITKFETPLTNSLINNINSLNKAVNLFSRNKTEESLNALKKAWVNTANTYSELEILNVGEIADLNMYRSIYSWKANETIIENYISSTNKISANAINSQPTSTRGLAAIEYLIYQKSSSETIASFNEQRRLDYLKAISLNLVNKTSILQKTWSNYRNSFINNNQTGINGGINRVINSMNFALENIRHFKIGKPAALESSTTINTNLLQAHRSKNSLKFIEKNIVALKNLYFGKTNGIDDLVASVSRNEAINTAVKNQFTLIQSNINAFGNTPLKSAITNNPTAVKNLYNSIHNLIVLIKTDVASALSVTITFTDNDGD